MMNKKRVFKKINAKNRILFLALREKKINAKKRILFLAPLTKVLFIFANNQTLKFNRGGQ